jgi:hypothetical protein
VNKEGIQFMYEEEKKTDERNFWVEKGRAD